MDLPRALPRSFPHFFPGTFARLAAFLLALTGLMMASTAQAQSILRDAETEKLLDDMSAPIIQAAGLQPRNVKIVLVNDKDINACGAGGQIVYIHSGLITAAASGLGVLLAPSYSLKGELDRGALVPLFPAIRPLEDRFALYQKAGKARLERHRLLTKYLQELTPAEFGA